MAIIFHKQSKCFHLYNNEVSYIMRIMENGQLENLYYGKKIHDKEDFAYFHDEAMRSQMSVCIPEPGLLSMQYTRQEYPSYGTGDYRSPLHRKTEAVLLILNMQVMKSIQGKKKSFHFRQLM